MSQGHVTQRELFDQPLKRKRVGKAGGVCRASEEQLRSIIRIYTTENVTLKELGERVGYSWGGVRNILLSYGIPIRENRKWRCTEEQRVEIVERYLNGENHKSISADFGISPGTVGTIARDAGVIRRGRGLSRQYGIDHAAFDELTEDARYWCGFLMADGCVMERGGSYVVQLTLSQDCASHVEKLRVFLKSKKPIRVHDNHGFSESTAKHRAVTLSVNSRRIGERLVEFGVRPRKTSDESARTEFAFCRHFWRGVVDGDGWHTYGSFGRLVTGLCGSKTLVSQFKEFVDSVCGISRAGVCKLNWANCYTYRVNTKRARTLARVLYDDCGIALERKAAIARSFYAGV